MDWVVKNALSRDTEREHLNKILADIRKTVNKTAQTTPTVQAANQTVITTRPKDITITLTGPVTGEGKGTTGISIATELSEDVVLDAPLDSNIYWRYSGRWLPVSTSILALDYIDNGGFLSWNYDEGAYYARSIEGTTDQIDVANGDGQSANPVISLSTLADSGTGTFKLIARDAYGRLSGTDDGTTDDVPEGDDNLYYTDARADARVLYGLQQNTSATYTDSYGIQNTLSISRASSFDDGGIRQVNGSFTARSRFSSTDAYASEYGGTGMYSYSYNPSQAGAYYTTYGISNAGQSFSFLNASIKKSDKGFNGTRHLTLSPTGIPDPSSGGFEQKVINVPYQNGTMALLSDIADIQQPAPLVVTTGNTYKVLANNQIPFMYPIVLEGTASIVIDGALVGII